MMSVNATDKSGGGFELVGGLLSRELYLLRAFFYLLTPNETYYQKAEDVPNLTVDATNTMLGLILFEQLIFLLKKKRFNGRINDSISSLSAGMMSRIPIFFAREMQFVSYQWIYDNFLLYEIAWDSPLTYVIAFLGVDMFYYWFHRAAHELNLFWAAHQTHHSAEDYNYTTSLRQTVFQQYTNWMFYLPLGLFVRPSIFVIHSHMNLLYQFWIHTEVIDSIGPLEYILNTPSHHRVHHGRNPYCIDKNYGGVLIIWDRLFGTFAAERPEENLAYGLVHPLTTFDPFYAQTFNYRYLWGRFWQANGISEKFSVLFKGPGWTPGTPRLGNYADLPEVEKPIRKYDVPMSTSMRAYIIFHFILVMLMYTAFVKKIEMYVVPNYLFISLGACIIVYTLTSFGTMLDGKSHGFFVECVRCLLFVLCNIYYDDFFFKCFFESHVFHTLMFDVFMASAIGMGLLAVSNLISGAPPATPKKHK